MSEFQNVSESSRSSENSGQILNRLGNSGSKSQRRKLSRGGHLTFHSVNPWICLKRSQVESRPRRQGLFGRELSTVRSSAPFECQMFRPDLPLSLPFDSPLGQVATGPKHKGDYKD